MGLLQRLQLAWYAMKGADIGGWHVSGFNQNRPYAPISNYKALIDRYRSWVYTFAHMNAVNCAQIPLRLYGKKPSKKSKSRFPTRAVPMERMKYLASSPSSYQHVVKAFEIEEITEHPFLELLASTNDFMNGFELMEMLFLAQELVGNAYWLMVFNGLRIPKEIWPLMPQYVKIIPDRELFISGYEYKPTLQEKHIIEEQDIIHFKDVNLKNAFYGYSPLEAGIVAADLGSSMNMYETDLFRNRAEPSFALKLPAEAGTIGDETRQRMYKEWKKRHGGRKVGGMTILSGGAELQQITLSPKEMAFLKGREASKEELAAVFGVPMSKITSKDVNRANADAGNFQYQSDTILPKLRKVEQKLNERLTPLYDTRIFCAFDNPVPADKEFRLKEIETNLKTGKTSINQERLQDGQEPVAWGDIPLLPINLVPLGTASSGEVVGEGDKTHKRANKAPRRLPPLERPAVNFVNLEFVATMQSFFKAQKKDILNGFDKDAEMLGKSVSKDTVSDNYVSSWFDMQKWNRELAAKTDPFLRATFLAGGEQALRKLTTEQQFDPINPRALTALQKHRDKALVGVNQVTAKKIRKSLADGLAEGEGIGDLRKRVESVYENADKHRAALIARTETIWAWNEGAVQAYIQSGVVTRKVWVSSGDERTCEFCPEMDGRTIEVTTDFFGMGDDLEGNKGGILTFEFDDIGHPPLHPMCRCTVAPEVSEF